MANTPLCEKLAGQLGFSNEPMTPPPSERGDNVIQFELTTGCSHGRCTFCDMYSHTPYQEKSIEDFERHVDQVLDFVIQEKKRKYLLERRVFIGAGDALGVDSEKFRLACQAIHSAFSKRFTSFYHPSRISVYGSVRNILNKGIPRMIEFNHSNYGSKVVYVGLESGSDEVLKIINKGNTQNEAVQAGFILRYTGISNSTMVMPGLGGKAYFDEHVRETARVLNEIRPKWITFMGLNVKKGTPYETWIKRQEELNKNRNLTPRETVEQTAQIIERLYFDTQIGVHGYDVHEGFCLNPISLTPRRITDYYTSAHNIANELRRQLQDSNL